MNDRFEAEGVTLILGDCREVLTQLSGIDAIISDPPYGGGYAENPIVGKGKSASNHLSQNWDGETQDFVLEFPSRFDIVTIWGGNYYALPPSRGWLTWFKPDAPPSMANVELCWTSLDQNARQISWSIAATNAERIGHPTQKPYRVMAWTMEQAHVPESAVVCDPYMGSGTTGIACIRTKRRFIGIEKDPAHFQTAVDRVKRELSQLKFAF